MRILVVDDEAGIRGLLTRIFASDGHDVTTAANGEEALAILDHLHVDLVLSDVRMPRMDGVELLRRHTERGGLAPVVMMSAFGDDDAAVEAIQRGAHDYLTKPFQPEQVLLVLRKAVERERLRQKVKMLSDELSLVRGDEDIIGRSDATRNLVSLARRAAPLPSGVLITGERGTGKELVARLIHRSGPRFENAFVLVDCAVPLESLLDGELFQPAPAASDGRGRFSPGTVFLADVDKLMPDAQARLASILGAFTSIGHADSAVVTPRAIAATTLDLAALVGAGQFNSALYYALSVIRLHVLPLRERADDIPDLALYFVASHARRLRRIPPRLSAAAVRALCEHSWPGNVREIDNVMERAIVLADRDEIRLELIEAVLRGRSQAGNLPAVAAEDLSIKRQTAALERKLIAIALDRCGGNRKQAAKVLDLSPRALFDKIKQYEL